MLTLPIKKGWYDLIAGGVKEEEYREIKPYYTTRFRNIFGATWENGEAPEQRVIFRNGYSADAPQLTALCGIRVGEGREEWGAVPGKRYYILEIKEILPDV